LIYQQQGDLQQAIASYMAATRYDDELVTAWINLTSALIMAEENEQALDAARKAIALDENFAMAQNNLAVALYFTRNYAGAKQHADKARELGYNVDPRFVEALARELP
jgi:tetratricopeptide (TPR) repeat protein